MTKRVMNKIISKIQFIIYSFFTFVLSLVIITVASLSYGINIPSLVLPGFKAEQLYIKLNKKIILKAKTVTVTLSNNSIEEVPLFEIPKVSPILDFVRTNFSKISIETLNIDNNIVSFSYMDKPLKDTDNSISYKGNNINALIFFKIYDDYVLTSIDHFVHKPTKIKIEGEGVYDFKEEMSFSQFKLIFADCAEVEIYTKENAHRLAFTAESNTFVTIKPIIDLFDLKPSISKWIVDYNQALTFKLVQAKGLHDYTDMNLILNTLYLSAKEKYVSYTFNEKLSPIVAKEVDITFTKGTLNVLPKNAFYNKHPIQDSDIKIDFNTEHVLLDLDLDVKTRASQDIIDIVEAYNIPLPLLQKSGETEANINLHIDLWTEKAEAKGQFFIKDSIIELDGIAYRLKNAAVRLNKSFLSIDTANISYKNMFRAKLNGSLDLKELVGDFYFNTDYINFDLANKQTLNLNDKTQIHLQYTKDSELIHFNTTQWKIDKQAFVLRKNSLRPRKKFSPIIRFSDLQIKGLGLADANLSGEFDLNKDYVNIEAELYNIKYQNKDLNISSTDLIHFNVIRDKNITHINFSDPYTLCINDANLSVKATRLRIKDDYLDIYGINLDLDNHFSTRLSIHHNLKEDTAEFTLEDTKVFSEDVLFIGPKFKVKYKEKNNKYYFDAKKLALQLILDKEHKKTVRMNDISKLHPYSELLKTYAYKQGSAKLNFNKNDISIYAAIENFKPLFVENKKEITQYKVRGNYKNNFLDLNINKKIHLQYKEDVNITVKDLDFNLYPILDYIKHSSKKDTKSKLKVFINASHSNVYLGKAGRRAIANTIEIEIEKSKVNAKLYYKEGGILFQSEGDNFSLYANGLDDSFMNALFKFSTFEGGELSASVSGNFKNYHTDMNINDTVIKDYTVLNNTLAFFNTIPALVTFSVPGYSSKGLKVSKAYASFDTNDSIVNIENLQMNSKELIITAEGSSDLENETIDVLMQVKTDIGSSAKDIPLVGYIIFGDDSISTTVHVHGSLKDPEVDTSAAKSVLIAPYNILKRTITLPLKLLDIFDDEEKKK